MSTALKNLALTDIRCFAGEHCVDLSRITLLVGENSVGKTTFMGCLNAMGHIAGMEELEDSTNWFDQPPYFMGSFDTLARPGSSTFRAAIGLSNNKLHRLAIEFAKGANSSLREVALELRFPGRSSAPGPSVTIARETSPGHPERWLFSGPDFQFSLDRSDDSHLQFTTWLSLWARFGPFPFSGETTLFKKRTEQDNDRDLATFEKWVSFFGHGLQLPEMPGKIVSVAPGELNPQRCYRFNPLEAPNGESDLARINEAGCFLGLFERIEARPTSQGDFEVVVDVSGSCRNLQDSGYGVASLLPFLVSFATAPRNTLFLLQHPEVNIHPVVQAKLVEMMAACGHAFVIETHSDHVMDWFRILVKEKRLPPDDVSIIYFESLTDDRSITRLHRITLDHRANISGQPRNYRLFFTDETFRSLGLPV